MTYEEIIQSVGKQISKSVYYYDSSNTKVDIAEDNIETIRIYFNTSIVGTLMMGADITLKEEIETAGAIYVKIDVAYGDDGAYKVYGPYYLKDKATYNADDKTYTHYCYDKMLTTMVEYKKINISFPTTIQSFFNSLINTLGLTSSVSLVNGNKTMSKDIYDGINYTYRSVLQDIAEANGVLFYIDGTTLKTATLGIDDDKATITDDILKNTNIEFGKIFGPLNTLILSRSADSDRVYYPDPLPNNPKEYTIYDNQLMNDDNRSDYMAGIFSKINGLTYNIFDTELVGYGGFAPLQKVEFETNDNTYTSYVFNNEITFSDGYSEVIYSDSIDETNDKYKSASSKDDKINSISLIVNKQEQTIQSLVSNMATVGTEKEGTGEIQLEGLLENPIMYLSIHPTNTDLTSVRAGTNIYASKSIYASSVVVVFDDIGTGKDYRYALPCDLLQLNGTYDEYVQDNKTKECYVLHKIGKVNGEKVILDTPYKETFTNQFMIGTGNYKIYVLNYNDAYIKAKALLMNDYTTQLATTYQVQSSITETAKEIMIEVNEKVDEDELNSAINVATGSIMAKVNEKVGNDEVIASLNIAVENHKGVVNLKGNSVIIDSDNFNLSADGTIECTNANISGEITSNEGTIGGWEINEKGFSNGVYYLKNNGFINAYTYADMIIIQNYLLGKLAIPDGAISHYDINNDGTITSYELLYFQKVFIDGIDPTAPSTQNDDEEDVSTQSDEEIPSDEEVGELPTQSE